MIYCPVKPYFVNRQMMTKRFSQKLSYDDFVTALEDVCGLLNTNLWLQKINILILGLHPMLCQMYARHCITMALQMLS